MICLTLFWNFLMIGTLSFGGGYGMISLVREVVLGHGWLTESEFLSFIAVSESTPGPLAVNMATFIGSSQAGLPGALVATLGVVLPSFVIILLVAAAVSGVTSALQGESFADVFIILAVVIVNAVLGVLQESKAEKAIEALQEMAAATSKVLRDGKIVSIPSHDLVAGDVGLLEAGDAVPADGRILEAASMKVEEAALTGESVPVIKETEAICPAAGQADVPLGDRKNMAYMGSTVVYGRGKAVITATGMKTEMGKIAGALADAKEEKTPLQKKLAQLSKILTWLVLGI